MIRQMKRFVFIILIFLPTRIQSEIDLSFGPEAIGDLTAGKCVVLSRRPDDGEKPYSRFVTVSALVEGTQREIWEVINDKENAADFIEGVLESKVIERIGNKILVEQRTNVGGPKGSYRYRLLHELKPMKQADFTYAGGELRNVMGTWWILEGTTASNCLVVYSLHIDPGFLAPQAVVKSGMRRSMPGTIRSVANEVSRRQRR